VQVDVSTSATCHSKRAEPRPAAAGPASVFSCSERTSPRSRSSSREPPQDASADVRRDRCE
jgi:hypothetical protein